MSANTTISKATADSLAHWQENQTDLVSGRWDGTPPYLLPIHDQDCPLCEEFGDKPLCKGCPVAKEFGPHCIEGPWRNVMSSFDVHVVHSENEKLIAAVSVMVSTLDRYADEQSK